jgi:hypothetical protein
MGEDLDGTRTALIIRAMDEESGETARLNEPNAGDLSKGPAVTSLVLGILAFVIQLLAWGDWFIRDRQQDAAFERFLAGRGPNPESPDPVGLLIWSSVSVAVGISAIVFGVKGRKLAKAEASGRISATTGLVLGIVSVAIPILALLAVINWLSCCLDNL